ncbi:MAG: hypothetical protein ABJZ55_12485 [Fuerstiella sp.]
MTRSVLTLFAIGFLSLGVVGCSKKDPAPAPAELKSIEAQGDSAGTSTETAVTKEQAEAFAQQLSTAISSGDTAAAGRLILSSRILDRVVSGLQLTGTDAAGFRRGMQSNDPLKNIVSQLANSVGQGGSYLLVRTAVRGGEMHAIFRLLDVNQSLNYHDFRLVMDGGTVKADQMFVAATGESIADTLITSIGPTIRSQQSLSGKLTGEAAQKLKDLKQQGELMKAVQSGNPTEALRIYEGLPSEMKDSKAVQLARVMASQGLTNDQYMAAMTDYANRFPNDPSVALMLFDRAVLKKDVDAVKECMVSLDQWTGGDDYLNLLAASVVSQWGAFEYAKELYTNADPAKIGTAMAHDHKLSAALRCKDNSVVLAELRILRDEFDMDFSLEGQELFADFVKTPQFQTFQSESKSE